MKITILHKRSGKIETMDSVFAKIFIKAGVAEIHEEDQALVVQKVASSPVKKVMKPTKKKNSKKKNTYQTKKLMPQGA